MTHQEFDERLGEILTDLVECSVDSSKHGYSKAYEYADDAKQAIRELFEEDAEQKQSKIMALVCAENGGKFSISRKTYEEYDDNCVLERLDSPLMDSVVYRLRTTITGKEGGDENRV